MNFNILYGHFAEPAALQKAALKATKVLGAIKDDAKKEQEAQCAPSKVPGEIVLAQMSNVAKPLQQEEQRQQVSNNYKKDSCLKSFIYSYRNLFSKNVRFDTLYAAKYKSIFNQDPKFEGSLNHNSTLEEYEYYKYRDNVQSALDAFQFNDNIREKIMNKYIENGRQVNETFYEKDFKMFKLILAQTLINGLQTRDYSFYTMPLKKDFILKVFDNCLNNPNQDFNTIYKNTVLEQQDQQLEEMGITKQAKRDENGNILGYLLTIPMTSSDDNSYENRVRFTQTHSERTWCTHTKKTLKYIQNGKFVIYEPINKSFSNIFLRYYGDTIVDIVDKYNNTKNINGGDICCYESIFEMLYSNPNDKKFTPELEQRYQNVISKKKIYEDIIKDINNIKDENGMKISTGELCNINEYLTLDEKNKASLKKFNTAYLNAFFNIQNLEKKVRLDDIENLNIIFRNSEDENIQILLGKIKAIYLNSPQAASSLIVPF